MFVCLVCIGLIHAFCSLESYRLAEFRGECLTGSRLRSWAELDISVGSLDALGVLVESRKLGSQICLEVSCLAAIEINLHLYDLPFRYMIWQHIRQRLSY